MKNPCRLYSISALLFVVQLCAHQPLIAQWHSCGGPNGTRVQMLCSDGTYLYSNSYSDWFKASSDNGASWFTPAGSGLPANYYLHMMFAENGNLFVSAGPLFGNSDLYVSNDHGNSFTNLNNGYVFPAAHDIAVSGNEYYLANQNGIEYSGDGGTIWSLVNTGLDNLDVKDLLISGSSVLAATADGVYITTNNGGSWSLSALHADISSFAMNGTDIYAAGESVYVSSDNGVTWTTISTGLPGDFYAFDIVVNNGYAFVCNGYWTNYGNYSTLLSTIDWQASNKGLFNTNISWLISQGNDLFCGGWTGIFKSINNGAFWTPANYGLVGIDVHALALDSPTVYSGSYYAGIFRSDDFGNSWLPVDSGLPQNLESITCLTASNNNVFAGSYTQGVYRSTNGGLEWTQVFNAIPFCFTQALAMIDSNIFMGTSDSGVYVSHNWGGTWTKMNYGLLGYNIVTLAANDTVIYAAVSGSGIFRSFDFGTSWNIFNSGLGSLNCTQLTSGGGNAYAAVGGKIYSSSNGSSAWTYLYGPIPGSYYGSFTNLYYIGAQNNTIFAAPHSFGGGEYRRSTVHSYDAGAIWVLDTMEPYKPETLLCVIPDAGTAFLGTGDNSVWCYGETSTVINDVKDQIEGKVFPNPSNGIFNFELNESEAGNLVIVNSLGKVILDRDKQAGNKKIQLDLSGFPKGMYFYQFQGNVAFYSGKIILE